MKKAIPAPLSALSPRRQSGHYVTTTPSPANRTHPLWTRVIRAWGQLKNHNVMVILTFLACFGALAQDKHEPSHPAEPTITFDLYWEEATPQNYIITLRASGAAKYVSRSPTRIPPGEEAADPEYALEFTMSPANRDRAFMLAKALNYFKGNFDFKHKIANTGRKTMIYADPVRYFTTTYNYSENKDMQELTPLFQGISGTIEHGRKLQFLHRFDKLGLERELKGMEEIAHNGYLAEIQIIASTLQSIANDSSVLHIARERAQRLLQNLNASQGVPNSPL